MLLVDCDRQDWRDLSLFKETANVHIIKHLLYVCIVSVVLSCINVTKAFCEAVAVRKMSEPEDDLNILFFIIKRKICKKTNKTNMIFFFFYYDTQTWGELSSLSNINQQISGCGNIVIKVLKVFPFLSDCLGSFLYGNRQSLSSFLSVKREMYWRNISGSPSSFHCDPHRRWQSPEQTRPFFFLNHRASHSYNMYIYSTCIEK